MIVTKINLEKWRQDLAAASEAKDAAKLTKLYAVRAHYRYRTHLARTRLGYELIEQLFGSEWYSTTCPGLAHDGGSMVVDLTYDQQAVWLGPKIDEYGHNVEIEEERWEKPRPRLLRRVLAGVLAAAAAFLFWR